ncbi:hypothetical protein BMS3Abin15_00639 [bacterium BMS3Abin15]|nr:hypothetical protein BMS3Abin15_00639 [bacterium BMS3Abin15]
MIWLLYKIEMRYSYSLFAILILGGVYDFFADGVLGTVLSGNFSLVTPALLLIIFPLFFISYSFIVFPATYLLQNDRTIQLNQKTNWKKYPFALLPLLGLLVYGIILVILF